RRQFPSDYQCFLCPKEGIAGFLDGQPLRFGAGLPTGVQRLLLFVVLPECGVGVVPRTEVVDFPSDLLAPVADRVSGQRIFGVRLGWLAGGCSGSSAAVRSLVRGGGWGRINVGHGDGSSEK